MAGIVPAVKVTIGMAQIPTRPERVAENLERHLEMLSEARSADVDILLFPELSVSGYLLAHSVGRVAMAPEDRRLEPLREASRGMTVVFGLPLRERDGGVSNAAMMLEDGEVVAIHRKLYLPTYGMFDEGRFFVPGEGLTVARSRLGRFGIMICEDAWHPTTAVLLARRRVDALLVLAGGPAVLGGDATPESGRRWEWIVGATAVTTVTPVYFVNRCGWEEGILFTGGSHAVDGAGRRLCDPRYLEPCLGTAPFDPEQVQRTRDLLPLVAMEREELWRREVEVPREL